MEKKTTQKKLSLKSETIRSLTPAEQGQVVGGGTTAITCTCPKTSACTTAASCGTTTYAR
jgi:hypothetical protein